MADKIKIFFFGDSICFGQGVSIHKGWVPRISAYVENMGKELGREFLLMNASVNGNTTRMALERMPYDIQSHSPDVVIVQFGMNDCNYWVSDQGLPRVSPRAFEANLHEIIERCQKFKAKKIILNTNHPTTRNNKILPHTELTYETSNKAYNQVVRKVATESKNVIFNDMEKVILDYLQKNKNVSLDQVLLPDELHLSELGHEIYFDGFLPSIESCLREIL